MCRTRCCQKHFTLKMDIDISFNWTERQQSFHNIINWIIHLNCSAIVVHTQRLEWTTTATPPTTKSESSVFLSCLWPRTMRTSERARAPALTSISPSKIASVEPDKMNVNDKRSFACAYHIHITHTPSWISCISHMGVSSFHFWTQFIECVRARAYIYIGPTEFHTIISTQIKINIDRFSLNASKRTNKRRTTAKKKECVYYLV